MLHVHEYIIEPSSQNWKAADMCLMNSVVSLMSNKTELSLHNRPFIYTDRRIM